MSGPGRVPPKGGAKFEVDKIEKDARAFVGDGIVLRNLTRDPLVWIFVDAKWKALAPGEIFPLNDGDWILFGKDPSKIEDDNLDPNHYTVLRVERHRLGPQVLRR